MSKIINLLVAVCASLVAITVGYVAHDFLHVSVRSSAMLGAAIFVLIYAVIFVIVPPEKFEKR